MPLIVRTTGLDEFLDPNGDAWVKTLIIGPPGSGKTPFASGFPKPFYIASEDGMMSVASKKLPYVRVKGSADFEAAVDYLANLCQRPAEKRPYGTVVVDTIDTLQKLLIQERLKAVHRAGMERPDWNWLASRMDNYLYRLLNLPMNLVVNMHDKDFREEYSEGGEERTRLVKGNALKGDVKDTIYGHFDLIGYLETYYQAEKGQRVLKRHIKWTSDQRYPMLRDRSYQLPEYTEVDFTEDDYNRIHDAVFGAATELEKGVDVETIETKEDQVEEVAPADLPGGPVEEPKLPPAKKTAAKKTAAKKTAAKPEGATTGVEQPTEAKPVTAESPSEQANAKAAEDAAMKERVAAKRAERNEKGTGTAPQDGRQQAQKDVGDKLEAERQERIAERDTEAPSQPSSSDSSEGGDKPAPEAEAGEKSAEQQLLEDELGATVVAEGAEQANRRTGEIPASAAPAAQAAAEAQAAEQKATPVAEGPVCGTPLPGMTALAEGCGQPLSQLSTVKFSIAQLRTKALICDGCFDKFKAA